MSRRRPFAFAALPVDTMSLPVAGVGASPYVDLSAPARCYGGYRGFGGLPPEAVQAARLGQPGLVEMVSAQNPALAPEAQIASDLLIATMSGNGPAVENALMNGIKTVAAAGAAAACAATGAGAVAAPVCGFIGGTIGGSVSRMLFPNAGKETCGEGRRRVSGATLNAFSPACKKDSQCLAELTVAANQYAERTLGSCALTDGWSMASTIRAEATKLGTALGKGENGIFGFASGDWRDHASDRLTASAGAAILAAKIRAWEKAAKAAKAAADKEYDTLSKSCGSRVRSSIGRTLTPCQQKAMNAATTIAARAYLYETVDLAPQILITENEAIRRDFLAELAQDKLIAANAAALAKQADLAATEARRQQSELIRAASNQADQRPKIVLGIALVTALVAGGIYLHRRRG